MPTQGSNIPVLTVEKFWLDKDGRGLYVHADGAVCNADTWSTGVSGGTTGAVQVLPAPSATAWLKINYMSGTAGTTTTGYIPIFNYKW